MGKSSERDKDARAAMRELMQAVGRVSNTEERPMTDAVWTATDGDVARLVRGAWAYADAMEAERAKRTEAEAPKPATPCPWRFDCIDCGVGIAADEDGCCKTCGRAAVVIKDGVPDYSMVAAGDESHDDADVEKACREGRDVGLREALATGICAMGRSCGMLARLRDMESTNGTPAPDIASLQSDLAKLRAVAEAAAALVDGMGGDDAMDLRADVKRALANWRSAP